MKTMVSALMFATLGLAAGCAHIGASAPALQPIADSAAWTITHASANDLDIDGKRAIRLAAAGDSANGIVGLALPRGYALATGTIDIDLKGKNVRQRSFVGVAFNVVDEKTFEAIYFRPFNFNAPEPARQRAVQYVAWPGNTWEYLRTNSPGQFEKSVNPVPDPDGWFHARVEVTDEQVKVFVNHASEPSLVTRRLSKGGVPRPVGLFVDSSDGHFANLAIAPLKP
jgi:hypothetical protein